MKPILINLKSRVKTSSSRVRREVLNGREHIVVPTRLMVSGVLNGSKGPLYYPKEEISRDEGAWNGMPLVVYHPSRNGQNVSARDPDILNSQGVGYVFKAHTQNKRGALDAEAWFDVEKTRQVDKRILENIEAGKPIEVSTGLFTTNEPAKSGATYNGKGYDYIARDYRPDHLAILPDQLGACSIEDGCGVLMTNEKVVEKPITENGGLGSGKAPELVPLSRNLDEETHGQQPHISPNTLMKAFDSTGFVTQAHEEGNGVVIAQNTKSVVETLKVKGWNHDSYQVKNGERTESMSKGNNRITLCSEGSRTVAYATRGHSMINNGGPGSGPRPGGGSHKGNSLKTVGGKASPGAVVKVASSATHMKSGATSSTPHPHAGKSGTVLEHNPELGSVKVKFDSGGSSYLDHKQVVYNQEMESAMTQEEREAVVNTLTTNCKCQVANTFSEDDREYLESLEDGKLKKLAANRQALIDSEPIVNTIREVSGNKTLTANAMPAFIKEKMAKGKKPAAKVEPDGDEPVENDDDEGEPAMNQQAKPAKPVTDAEWLKSAPKGIRSAVQNAQKIEQRHRTELIEKLTANVNEDRIERMSERYEAMDTDVLEDLVTDLPSATQNQEYQEPVRRRQANYAGSGSPIGNRQTSVTINAKERQETIDAMSPPTLNYKQISEENANQGRRKQA